MRTSFTGEVHPEQRIYKTTAGESGCFCVKAPRPQSAVGVRPCARFDCFLFVLKKSVWFVFVFIEFFNCNKIEKQEEIISSSSLSVRPFSFLCTKWGSLQSPNSYFRTVSRYPKWCSRISGITLTLNSVEYFFCFVPFFAIKICTSKRLSNFWGAYQKAAFLFYQTVAMKSPYAFGKYTEANSSGTVLYLSRDDVNH